jgi:hypothetical protein
MLRQRGVGGDKHDQEPGSSKLPHAKSESVLEPADRKRKKRGSSWLHRLTSAGEGSFEAPDKALKLFMDFVGLPLLILASVAIVYVLVQGRDIIQPLFFAIFFNYLIRPLMDCLTTPFDQCIRFAWSDPNPLAGCPTLIQIISQRHEFGQPDPMSIQACFILTVTSSVVGSCVSPARSPVRAAAPVGTPS